MSLPGARLAADQIRSIPRQIMLEPPPEARAALAARLNIPEVPRLAAHFTVFRDPKGAVIAQGMLDAEIVQEDITTLEPFAETVAERFTLRFLPEGSLSDAIDPDDPIDEVGYAGNTIDLEEAMYEQLALALDPYPRKPEARLAPPPSLC